jgi:hypothetical protein
VRFLLTASTVLAFLHQWRRGIDPFAIQEALRTLREAGVEIDPHVLERHYLTAGGVDALVDRILENERSGSPEAIHELCAIDLVDESDRGGENPKLVNPAGWAMVYSVTALAVMTVLVLPLVVAFRRLIGPWFLIAAGGLAAVAVGSATSFAFLGARYGRRTANRLVGLVLALLLVVGIVVLVYFGGRL